MKVVSLAARKRQRRQLSQADRDYLLEQLLQMVVDLEREVEELRVLVRPRR